MLRYILILVLFTSSFSAAASISPRTYNLLNDIQEQVAKQPDAEKIKQLNSELQELAEDLSGNSLGLALTYQTHAQLKTYEQKESEAQALLRKALALPNLKNDTSSQLRSILAYSYFNQGDYQSAIEQLKIIINKSEKPSANIYALLAAAFYSIEKIEEGLPHIETACELSEAPKEAWLQMAFSGNYQIKRYEKAISYVNQLIYNYPDKKEYWQQKAGIHQILEDYPKAATTKELSYKKGFIEKEGDFISLGQLLASQGDAYKVAVVLEQALNNKVIEPTEKVLNLHFQAWLQAKEIDKAIAALSTLYTSFGEADDGFQLLQYYTDNESWQSADELANKLLKQSLTEKQKGKVLLYQGMAKYRLGDDRESLKILGKATAFENSASQAKSWMSYIKQMGV
jgi:tetratricopeptide (TPR) repeat protein